MWEVTTTWLPGQQSRSDCGDATTVGTEDDLGSGARPMILGRRGEDLVVRRDRGAFDVRGLHPVAKPSLWIGCRCLVVA